MKYCIYYFLSVFAVWLVIGMTETSDGRSTTPLDRYDFLSEFFMTTLWPLTIVLVLPAMFITGLLRDQLLTKAKDAAERCCLIRGRNNNKQDRSFIVTASEKDLKLILKAYRKQLIELDPPQVEILRDELMHRLTERSLLNSP